MEKGTHTLYQDILAGVKADNNLVMLTHLNGANQGEISEFHRTIVTQDMLESSDAVFQVLKDGKPCILDIDNGVFAEPFYPMERLIVLGGGHIALPLVEIANKIGFDVTVVDDRPSFANEARFPLAKQVLCESFDTCFESLKITKNDYIVIITRGHKHDIECLRQILKRPETIYVGMIGSRKRVGIVKDQLKEEGCSQERLERICTPIGLAIGAVTPEEITISIVAQLIQRKRVDAQKQFLINRSDLEFEMIETIAGLTQVRCCLVTIMDATGPVPRGEGAKMLVFSEGNIIGSIGGGCSESSIMYDAIRMIGTGKWMIQEIDMTASAEDDGMVCGGKMKVLIEDLS